MKEQRPLYVCLVTIFIISSVCFISCNNRSEYMEENNGLEYSTDNIIIKPEIDEPYILSDILMLKITKNYIITSSYEFDQNEIVPYNEAFKYFMFDGCYSFDERCINTDLRTYYDPSNMIFCIPADIVEEYLLDHFNTIPEPETVEYYNQETNVYCFPRHFGEFPYDMKIVSKNSSLKNFYSFTVEVIPAIDSSNNTIFCSFIVELTDDGYKIHSFKTGDG